MKHVFELVRVYDFEITSSSEGETLHGRIELLKSLNDPKQFRLNTSVLDAFRLNPSFGRGENREAVEPSDEFLLTRMSIAAIVAQQEDFAAADEVSASDYILRKIDEIHDHLVL